MVNFNHPRFFSTGVIYTRHHVFFNKKQKLHKENITA